MNKGNGIEYNDNRMIRKETREEKIKIISSLPNATVMNDSEVNYAELTDIINRTKEGKYSYTSELMNIKEFNNTENIKKIISHYKINEKETHFTAKQFNQEGILNSYDELVRNKKNQNLSKTLFK